MTFTFLSKAVLCRMLPFKEKLCFRRTNYDSKIQNAHVFLFTSCETASFAERHRQKKYLPQVTDILLHILIQPPSCPHLILTCLSPPPPLPTWTAQPILFLLSLLLLFLLILLLQHSAPQLVQQRLASNIHIGPSILIACISQAFLLNKLEADLFQYRQN